MDSRSGTPRPLFEESLPLEASPAFGRPSGAGKRSTFSRAEFKYPWERGAILDFGGRRGGKMTAAFKMAPALPERSPSIHKWTGPKAWILILNVVGLSMRQIQPLAHKIALNSTRRLPTLQKRRVPSLSSFPSF